MFRGKLGSPTDWNTIKSEIKELKSRDKNGGLIPKEMKEARLVENFTHLDDTELTTRSGYREALDGEKNYSPYAHRRRVMQSK